MGLVKCQICGLHFTEINHRHLSPHGVTLEEYRRKFPGAPTIDKDFLEERGKLIGDARRDIPLSEEARENIRQGALRKFEDPTFRRQFQEMMKRRASTEEFRANQSQKMTEKWEDPEHRRIVVSAIKEAKNSPHYCQDQRVYTDEDRKELSERMKQRWATDPKFQRRQGLSKKPYWTEELFTELLDKNFPGVWRFVGDYKFFVDGKCPDYVDNITGKFLIELFGNRHHVYDEKLRGDHFKKHGYEVLFVWCRDLLRLEGFNEAMYSLEKFTRKVELSVGRIS